MTTKRQLQRSGCFRAVALPKKNYKDEVGQGTHRCEGKHASSNHLPKRRMTVLAILVHSSVSTNVAGQSQWLLQGSADKGVDQILPTLQSTGREVCIHLPDMGTQKARLGRWRPSERSVVGNAH